MTTTAMATRPGNPDRDNEDWTDSDPDNGVAVVLDGVSAPVDTGCEHGVAWYVNQLGPALMQSAADPGTSLATALADAIDHVADLHPGCQLDNPATPAAAVGIARQRGNWLDWLVLADITLVLHRTDRVDVVSDHRVDHALDPNLLNAALAATLGTDEHAAAVADMASDQLKRRNVHGGYWVASSDRTVARYALTGRVRADQVHSATLMSDGASCLVNTYNAATWDDVVTIVERDGPDALINHVRDVEAADPDGTRWPRFKPSDDAAVNCLRPHDTEDDVTSDCIPTPRTHWKAFAYEIEPGIRVRSRGSDRLVASAATSDDGNIEVLFADDGPPRVLRRNQMVSVVVDGGAPNRD
ncbi:hypothetical protein FB384_004949 [Prauserella sediminis]|uniref:Uncharacterized protein n=1 Tax=Prauserella sediminis TaxID=577680 RepID=A0A839XS31_9PSEU|nr:hypothetical protein [Prauserella sediminis]MBB3665990.1 hypothetical protein [Prauserella sediminis]